MQHQQHNRIVTAQLGWLQFFTDAHVFLSTRHYYQNAVQSILFTTFCCVSQSL